MPLSDLLNDALGATDSDCWDRERTATPVRAFAVRLHSAGLSLRETVAILDFLGLDRYMERSGTGRTASQTIRMTRRGALRGGSPSTRQRFRSARSGGGVTLQSTSIRWLYWRLNCSAAAGPIPRRRSSHASRSITISRRRSCWSTVSAIGPLCPDWD